MLTDAEHALITKLGECFNEFCIITNDGSNRDHDLSEAALHVHALQHAVMANAAAREYPHLYRVLGGGFGVLPHEHEWIVLRSGVDENPISRHCGTEHCYAYESWPWT